MAVDNSLKIAIVGAGPIGLEAALYARYLGYDVAVFERGRVADSVLQWGHVRMFSPFSMNRSVLGLAALAAQDASHTPPADDKLLTGEQWYRRYLLPLAEIDLLADAIRQQTAVVSIARQSLLKTHMPGSARRGEERFRLLLRDARGAERIELADVMIDASGTFAQPNWLGQAGIPAVGEIACRERIDYGLPDVLGSQRERFLNRSTLVVGSGHSAATNVIALAKLAREAPETQVTWVTRRAEAGDCGPVALIDNDRLAERYALSVKANRLASSDGSSLRHFPATAVSAISFDESRNQFAVEFDGELTGSAAFDNVIANVGGRPDTSIYRELQVHQCYATEGPMKLAAALLGETSADCLDQTSHGPQTLVNPEPNFYILGAKSYGRNSNFLFSIGLEQIREVFTLIAGQEDLDLYSSVTSLTP